MGNITLFNACRPYSDFSLSRDAPRSLKRIKLFRIDGDIDVDKWIELLSQFFKGNEMIIEYFDPELFQQKFPDQASKSEPPAQIPDRK